LRRFIAPFLSLSSLFHLYPSHASILSRIAPPAKLQIAQVAAAGLSNKDIGRQLFLSHRTIGSHLYRIFPKLGITTRSQLVAALQSRSAQTVR